MTDPAGNAADQKADHIVGRVIANAYRLDEMIGKGAMGKVYRAEQLSLGKAVAIKVLHPHLSGDPRVAKRFHREAKAASRLSHPNSLQIIDHGVDEDGTLFIAMELLEGEDLQTIIDHDAPLTPARINDLMAQTLRALDEAHHAGIIHRDLKPENVVVSQHREGERVKVCDFGIAKIIEQEGRSTAITKDGFVCGTPEYMAPEQARGEEIDHRADLYAAGAMLYQMLCGRVPFKAENAIGVITKHLMEAPVPPRRVQPEWGIPKALQRVALTALSKDRGDRFESAKEMSTAIGRAVDALGDDADTRLGEGVFADDTDPEPEPNAAENRETPTAVVDALPLAPRREWLYLVAGALVIGAVAIVWWVNRAPGPQGPVLGSGPQAVLTSQREDDPASNGSASNGSASNSSASNGSASNSSAASGPAADHSTGGDSTLPGDSPPETTAAARRVPPPGTSGQGAPVDRPASSSSGRGRADRTHVPTPEPPPRRGALELGRAALLAGDLPTAVAHFERAARSRPNNAQIQRQLGRAYMRRGDVAQGISAYRRYLQLAPDAPDRAIIERILAQRGG